MQNTDGYIKKAALKKEKMKQRLKNYIDSYKSLKKCENCRENCEFEFICCNVCEKSYHRKCLKLSKIKFENLRKMDSFICSNTCYNSILPFHDLDNIDFLCVFRGNGEYPCLKCKRDCLGNMACISCSAVPYEYGRFSTARLIGIANNCEFLHENWAHYVYIFPTQS